MDIITVIVVSWLTNGCIIPISASLSNWWTFSPDCNPLPYTYLFIKMFVPWKDGYSTTLTLPTTCSLAFLKFGSLSLEVNHSAFNYRSYSLYNMTCILEFLDVTNLIQTYVYMDAVLTIVDNMSSNTTWYCGEIELVKKFIANPTCV